jgi:hypothetical protein
MPRFGLVGPAYRSQSVNADCQVLINLYLEMIESGQGKGSAALYCTPGLNKLYDLGPAPVRGIITAQSRTFAVAGATLYELLAPAAVPNKIAIGQADDVQIANDGKPVSMASGPTQVLIASAQNLYCLQLVDGKTTNATGAILPANSLTLIPQYNNVTGYGLLGPVSQVAYGDGFFFALIANSNQIQASNPVDGSSWQGVRETQVSVFSDNVISIFVDHRLMWVFGPKNTQPYFDSGNFPFPYDVIQGGFIEQGIAAQFSVAKIDNSIFWLGQDERGQGIVWRANGYQPVRISTHAIEYEFGTFATMADAVCYAYQDQGHTFYVMNFPTAQKTWVYDCATQTWHQRGYSDQKSGNFIQSLAGFHTFNFGIHLVGDPTTGAIYQQSVNFLSDNGTPIRRVRRAPHISTEQSRIVHTRLQLDVETGLGPTFPWSTVPTLIPMKDAAGALRNLAIDEMGRIQTPVVPGADVSLGVTLFLNDRNNTTSWQLTINGIGEIDPVLLPKFYDSYPLSLSFVSVLGDKKWAMQLNNLGGGLADLLTYPIGVVGRGPQVMLRWSDDGGHTWSNSYARDCGQAGAYNTRVKWDRLGQSRDRVYEISMSDPIPWRIVDAYLFTSPEDRVPVSRYASELRKRA